MTMTEAMKIGDRGMIRCFRNNPSQNGPSIYMDHS